MTRLSILGVLRLLTRYRRMGLFFLMTRWFGMGVFGVLSYFFNILVWFVNMFLCCQVGNLCYMFFFLVIVVFGVVINVV